MFFACLLNKKAETDAQDFPMYHQIQIVAVDSITLERWLEFEKLTNRQACLQTTKISRTDNRKFQVLFLILKWHIKFIFEQFLVYQLVLLVSYIFISFYFLGYLLLIFLFYWWLHFLRLSASRPFQIFFSFQFC